MSQAINEARETLIRGGDLVDLAEAIGTIISDPASSLDDIRLGLRYGGVVADQATLELRRREACANVSSPGNPIVLARDNVPSNSPTEAR
jgi:hypothetical protein